MKRVKLNRGDVGRIRECITHWRRLEKMVPHEERGVEAPDAEWCALCLYYGAWTCETTTERCPLAVAGQCCHHTCSAYTRAYEAWRCYHKDKDIPKWKAAARDMIKVLESLLPKRKKVKP